MFDIGWGEMVVIGVVALVAIGPKQLPGALRTAGHWVGRARRMASDFQGQFQEALREADVAEMKKQFDDAANAASSMATPNLLGSIKGDIEDALKVDAQNAAEGPADPGPGASGDAPAANSSEVRSSEVVQDVPLPAPAVEKPASEPAPAVSGKPS